MVERAKSLSSQTGKTADEAMTALQRVGQISARNTRDDVEQALAAVTTTQEIENKNLKAGQELIDFIRQNETDLRQTELSDLPDMAPMYGDSYQTYRSSLNEFLAAFKLMLEFERDNFPAVSRRKQPEESRYQKLYDNYMTALEKQNHAYKAQMAVVETVGKQNPRLEELVSEILSTHRQVR